MKTTTVSRRDFLAQSAALLSTVGMAASGFSVPSKYKMGLQLFSIREPLSRDVLGTLKEVRNIGYEDLEIYGFEDGKYYGLKPAELKHVLDDLNLITTSGHYGLHKYLNTPEEALMRYVDQCVEGAHALGQRYITWPWLDPDSRTLEKFRLLSSRLNKVGEQIKKAGLGFAYHNHDFEFIDHDGDNGYSIILRETDPSLVKLQIDLYWAVHSSKLSPAELFSLQPGRYVMWHIKDMDKVTRDYTELGNGSIDYTKILPDAKRAGLQYYYLEQGGNFAKDPMTSVEDSAAFFKSKLEQLL